MRKHIIFAFLLLFFSCDSNIEFINYNSVNGSWHKDSIQDFSFELNHLQEEEYKTYINLRINNDYKFSNIFLIVVLSDSLNIITKDTLNFKLADKSGIFLGDKRINLIENSLLHKEKISLENNMKYYVSIEHAMRVINKVGGLEYLNGVVDVGYKVEKIK
jgi:gliding motility-associated lipoprotein GldH|tara:strand:- start:86 stop:565 length:480 start_codon:yes stop_codon:yes gene_type:complete